MKKIAFFVVLLLVAVLNRENVTYANVSTQDRPENLFNFMMPDIRAINHYHQENEFYISVYDLDGNFLGGNYYSNIRFANSQTDVIVKGDTDYVFKIEGEGFQTKYEVRQAKQVQNNVYFEDDFYVLPSYTTLKGSYGDLSYAGFGFKHDITLVKDKRTVGSAFEKFEFKVMPGNYTLQFGKQHAFDMTLHPGQTVSVKPNVAQNISSLSLDRDDKIPAILYDEEGYIVYNFEGSRDTLSELMAGSYTLHYGAQQYPIIVDDLSTKRSFALKEISHLTPGVKFKPYSLQGLDSLKQKAVELIVKDSAGKEIAKYRNYQGDIIALPSAGQYTVTVNIEGFYPLEQTFTYNSEIESLEVNLLFSQKAESVWVNLYNDTNVNKASAQVELINNATGEITYALLQANSSSWVAEKVEPGHYTMKFKASGYETFEQQIAVYPTSTVSTLVFLTASHPWYSRYEKYDDVKVVPKDKVWKVNFSQPISQKHVTNETIYVTDGNGIRLNDVELTLTADRKSVLVKRANDYTPGTKYMLYVSSKVKSTSEKAVRDTMLEFVAQ